METITQPEEDHGRTEALAQLANIVLLTQALQKAMDDEDDEAMRRVRQEIDEDPLNIEVRSNWHAPGADSSELTEYRILLCWGGPACRIRGDLNQHGEPESCILEHQDWGTPWTELVNISEGEREALLEYARNFYFGE